MAALSTRSLAAGHRQAGQPLEHADGIGRGRSRNAVDRAVVEIAFAQRDRTSRISCVPSSRGLAARHRGRGHGVDRPVPWAGADLGGGRAGAAGAGRVPDLAGAAEAGRPGRRGRGGSEGRVSNSGAGCRRVWLERALVTMATAATSDRIVPPVSTGLAIAAMASR
jgi:hypothetical protein